MADLHRIRRASSSELGYIRLPLADLSPMFVAISTALYLILSRAGPHDEPEQLEERTGLPREGVIVETVGVPDLRGRQADRVTCASLWHEPS